MPTRPSINTDLGEGSSSSTTSNCNDVVKTALPEATEEASHKLRSAADDELAGAASQPNGPLPATKPTSPGSRTHHNNNHDRRSSINSVPKRSPSYRRPKPVNLAGPSFAPDDSNLARIAVQRRASLARTASTATATGERLAEPTRHVWGVGGVFPVKKQGKGKRGRIIARDFENDPQRPANPREGSYASTSAISPSSFTTNSAHQRSPSTRQPDTRRRSTIKIRVDSLASAIESGGPVEPFEKADPFASLDLSTSRPPTELAAGTAPLQRVCTWPPVASNPADHFQSRAPTLLEGLDAEAEIDKEATASAQPEDEGSDETLQVGGQLNESSEQWVEEFDPDEEPPVRNQWGRIRYVLREPMAEFLGMLVLIVLGIGVDCQVKISQNSQGTRSDQAWVWGFATMSAIYIAGGISGGHVNPSITIALAMFRGFPWRMVPRYIIAQIFGAFVGTFLVYGIYYNALMSYDSAKTVIQSQSANASAPLFVTQPNPEAGGTPSQAFFQEILATAVLTIVVLALGDEHNAPPGAGLGAVVIGFVVTSIGNSMGWISGYAINAARDFGPRAALAVLGYGPELWTHDSWWWLIGPICGTTIGAIVGSFFYDLLIFVGPGSPINSSKFEIKHSLVIPATKAHSMVLAKFRRTPMQDDVEATAADANQKSRDLMRKLARMRRRRAGRAPKEEIAVHSRWTKAEERIKQEELRATREHEIMLEQEGLRAAEAVAEADRALAKSRSSSPSLDGITSQTRPQESNATRVEI